MTDLANRIPDAFDNIKADSQLKEATKQFLADQRNRNTGRRRPAFRWAVAAACIALLLTVGIGGYAWIQMPVSYVSIDVNPSIEFALNRFDRVMSVTAYNEEGAEIIEDLSLEGKKYTDAIHILVESDGMKSYLTSQNELVFTVAAEDSREDELRAGVESCSGHIECDSSSFSADLSIVAEAHEHAVSVGKYNAYLQLSHYDDTITVDDCRHMTMSEIHDLIDEHHQNGGYHGDETSGSEDSGHQEGEHHGEDHH